MKKLNFFVSRAMKFSNRRQLIYNYQLKGTFEGKWDPNDSTVFNNYCCRLLRLNPDEESRVLNLDFLEERYQLLSEGRAEPGMR